MKRKIKVRVFKYLYYSFFFMLISCVNFNLNKVNKNLNSNHEVLYFKNVDKNNRIGKSYFINLDEEIIIKTIKYKRFKLISNNKTVADGFWSVNLKDTIYFIPNNSYKSGCDVKLKFYINNNNKSYYLGRNCNYGDYYVGTDVLVENKNFKKINKIFFNKFYHSIVTKDDFAPGVIPDAVSKRCFLINLDYGVFYLGKFEEESGIYWFNY
ncbi:hypothetical protein [Flavobacterium sp. LMO9]|jgi:hypothetical protein|uniref:hypothetical protein n=1 Tax=Flavobacterium sp. LMO9 TaxID=2654245 RepID=UPI0012920BAA|nr:hypothetical protein [Flavobacterium sp. LMO9]